MNKKYLSEVVLLTKSYNLQDFKDWLHWHLDIIGFDHVHIFDNESTVDIKTVCDEYCEKVSYEYISGWPNQCVLYNNYVNNSSAWWVLTIDDDEFLYISKMYNHDVNTFILNYLVPNKIKKFGIGWRNLFPSEFQKERNLSLIENATCWSDEASAIWQIGNKPVKPFLLTTEKYFFDKTCQHNPKSNSKMYNYSNNIVSSNIQDYNTKSSDDIILYHYQFKSDNEWRMKCKTRRSPCSNWNKNFPEKYKELYKFDNYKIDFSILELWKQHDNRNI